MPVAGRVDPGPPPREVGLGPRLELGFRPSLGRVGAEEDGAPAEAAEVAGFIGLRRGIVQVVERGVHLREVARRVGEGIGLFQHGEERIGRDIEHVPLPFEDREGGAHARGAQQVARAAAGAEPIRIGAADEHGHVHAPHRLQPLLIGGGGQKAGKDEHAGEPVGPQPGQMERSAPAVAGAGEVELAAPHQNPRADILQEQREHGAVRRGEVRLRRRDRSDDGPAPQRAGAPIPLQPLPHHRLALIPGRKGQQHGHGLHGIERLGEDEGVLHRAAPARQRRLSQREDRLGPRRERAEQLQDDREEKPESHVRA